MTRNECKIEAINWEREADMFRRMIPTARRAERGHLAELVAKAEEKARHWRAMEQQAQA